MHRNKGTIRKKKLGSSGAKKQYYFFRERREGGHFALQGLVGRGSKRKVYLERFLSDFIYCRYAGKHGKSGHSNEGTCVDRRGNIRVEDETFILCGEALSQGLDRNIQ